MILEFNEDPLEVKKNLKTLVISATRPLINITNYFSIIKVQRTIVYCLRFVYNCKLQKYQRDTDILKNYELFKAPQLLIKYDQNLTFKQKLEEQEGIAK